MTDHANELRRYSRKIGHPAGDVPSVMLAAAEEIERLAAKLEAAETELAELRSSMKFRTSLIGRTEAERDDLRAKITEMERQEPVTLDHLACVDNGVLRFMTGRKAPAHDCELYAMPNGKAAPMLYALPGAKGEEK